MKKKWFYFILAGLLLVSVLIGCQNEESTLQLKEEGIEKTVLTFFLPIDVKSYNVGIYKDVIAEFNRQSNTIEIRVDGLSTADGYNQALQQRLDAGGEGADLFMVNADSVKQLYENGYFYDLSSLPAYGLLNEAAQEQSVIDGTVYTIPLQMTAYGLYVNVGLLRQYGLEPPKNLNEFLHCCEVLKENGITPLSINRWYAMTCLTMSRGLYPMYQAENTDQIVSGLNDGSIKISEYMLEGFQFFADFIHKGYYGDSLQMEDVNAIKAGTTDLEDFLSGNTAFAVFTTDVASMISENAPEIEYIQQGFPVLPDGTISMPAIAARICVNAKGAHVKEALDAVNYLTVTRAEEFIEEGSSVLVTLQNGNMHVIEKQLELLYKDMHLPGQIPIEDMSLHFNYWDTTRQLCLEIIGGMAPEEAAEKYDQIQEEQIRAYEINERQVIQNEKKQE